MSTLLSFVCTKCRRWKGIRRIVCLFSEHWPRHSRAPYGHLRTCLYGRLFGHVSKGHLCLDWNIGAFLMSQTRVPSIFVNSTIWLACASTLRLTRSTTSYSNSTSLSARPTRLSQLMIHLRTQQSRQQPQLPRWKVKRTTTRRSFESTGILYWTPTCPWDFPHHLDNSQANTIYLG